MQGGREIVRNICLLHCRPMTSKTTLWQNVKFLVKKQVSLVTPIRDEKYLVFSYIRVKKMLFLILATECASLKIGTHLEGQIQRAEVKSAYKIKHMFKKDRIRFATSVCTVCMCVQKMWWKFFGKREKNEFESFLSGA